jgi:hypothetical protein
MVLASEVMMRGKGGLDGSARCADRAFLRFSCNDDYAVMLIVMGSRQILDGSSIDFILF